MNRVKKRQSFSKWFFMRTLHHIPFYLGRAWLVAWVLVVPLIHLHPEMDHAHGAPGHVHVGEYHSILSEDRSWNFRSHSQVPHSDSFEHASDSVKEVHAFGHDFTHPEIGFSLLNKSKDDPLIRPRSASFVALGDPLCLKTIRFLAETVPSRGSPPTWLFVTQHRVRPPPSLPI